MREVVFTKMKDRFLRRKPTWRETLSKNRPELWSEKVSSETLKKKASVQRLHAADMSGLHQLKSFNDSCSFYKETKATLEDIQRNCDAHSYEKGSDARGFTMCPWNRALRAQDDDRVAPTL